MSTRRIGAVLGLGILAMLGVAAGVACGGGGGDSGAEGKPTLETFSGDSGGGSGGGTAVESPDTITVILKDNVYEPKDLKVAKGKTVTILVKNQGQAIHNMHVLSKAQEGKDFSSAATVNPGAENKFTVKFAKSGRYAFQCDYHLPDMSGTITVE